MPQQDAYSGGYSRHKLTHTGMAVTHSACQTAAQHHLPESVDDAAAPLAHDIEVPTPRLRVEWV